MSTLDARHAELAQCRRDLACARDRLAANPHDLAAKRWEAIELAHLERVQKLLGVRP